MFLRLLVLYKTEDKFSLKVKKSCAEKVLKGALHDLQPHPPTYSKKVEIFIPSETLDYIIFVCI